VPLKRGSSRLVVSIPLSLAFLLGVALLPAVAHAVEKERVVSMSDYFRQETPLTYTPGRSTPAVTETTIRHQVFFSDMDGSTAGWNVIDFRAGQPSAWHLVTGGAHACVGTSWWMGQTGFMAGDGYDNNWVQSLTTNVPINLAGTTGNKLTFKSKFQAEDSYDFGWVLIKGASAGAKWDTLAYYTGNLGTSCVNQTISISDSFTTVTQPITLQFLFGSDLNVSAADDTAHIYTGWTIDDVQVKSQGNPPGGPVRFLDDMESGSSKWVTSTPDPGTLWHLESSPGTSTPASCFFLNTQLWVPFAGSGFGIVPNHSDAMLTSPPMDITGVFSAATPTTALKLQFDDWENVPFNNYLYWSLWIRGSNDQVTWTPWKNALGFAFSSLAAQCKEGNSINFDPYYTARTAIQPGTKYIQLGFRIRDEKATTDPDGPRRLDFNTEGIYFDNIGVYYIYTISGAEATGGVPAGSRASIGRVFPNPFNPSTTIEFSVPKQGPTTVRVFDLRGRQITTLVDASMPAGTYRTRWDGRDASGRDVSSGLYFAMIESAGGRQAARLILLK
jgi:hypothetical protein